YGYNAFWADVLPLLDLPEVDLPPRADGTMHWGDGFEIETVLNCRVAAAGLAITEVPSMERERMFGETNLRTFADGTRVLRTLASERKRASRTATPAPPAASPSTPAPTAVPQAEASAPVNGRRYVEPPTVQTTLPSTASVPPVAHEGNGSRPMTPSPTPRAHRPQENGHRPTGTDGAARSDAVGVRYAWGEEAS
ncbi:MAG: hypothetical protein ABW212_12035, partial [Pseudonocardia sediminis]